MDCDTFRLQGRSVSAAQIQWLDQWIGEHPDWSRKRIARELCLLWQWRDDRGRLKDFAARSLLLKLDQRGLITLPALRLQYRRRWQPPPEPARWQEPPIRNVSLDQLQPLSIESVDPVSTNSQRWAFLIDRYHYLGFHVIGENIGYLVRDHAGEELACLLFGAAAWRCADRDRYLGGSTPLSRIANNTRFLILPWIRAPHLASHLLSRITHRINSDWMAKYNHPLHWLETFVEVPRFTAACYRAANWRRVGQTRGRTRQDRDHHICVTPKDIYLYPLKS